MKLYNPDKCSSFQMQFGFEQPLRYIKRNENKRHSKKSVNTEASLKR